jgi:NDP-sugar pyrophosphorylase family protein
VPSTTSILMPPLAVLAGGLATRLRPLTATTPKSLVGVAGEPFIAHQLRLFVRNHIEDIVVCTGFLSDQIEEFVGDGSRFGCRVRYSRDGERRLGTGGALRRALPLLGERFFVTYGDSYLTVPYRPIWEAFRDGGWPALMVVLRNEGRWDTSNVAFSDGMVERYDKRERTETMRYIDYGLGAIDAAALAEWPADTEFDLAAFYGDLVRRHQLAGYEVYERFYEIGSPEGLRETDALLRRSGSEASASRFG